VAVAIELKEMVNVPFTTLLYDLGRNIFGLSFLFKGQGILTATIYNSYIYGSYTEAGHVIPSVGYGFLYMGAILSPFIACLNIWLGTKFETLLYRTKSYEAMYLWGYIL